MSGLSGYQASRGASAPVLLRGSVPSSYPLAAEIEQVNIQNCFCNSDICFYSLI